MIIVFSHNAVLARGGGFHGGGGFSRGDFNRGSFDRGDFGRGDSDPSMISMVSTDKELRIDMMEKEIIIMSGTAHNSIWLQTAA